jgi:hypothetical protein
MAVIEHLAHSVETPGIDERAARADLRAQIARIERELAHIAAATYPRLDLSPVTPAMTRGPRVLALGELEQVRDALADRLAQVRRAAIIQAEGQAEAREELACILADPRAYRGARMTNRQLGLPGCTTYEVVPRLGVLGRLASWWHVKVSSGCPLGWGP